MARSRNAYWLVAALGALADRRGLYVPNGPPAKPATGVAPKVAPRIATAAGAR